MANLFATCYYRRTGTVLTDRAKPQPPDFTFLGEGARIVGVEIEQLPQLHGMWASVDRFRQVVCRRFGEKLAPHRYRGCVVFTSATPTNDFDEAVKAAWTRQGIKTRRGWEQASHDLVSILERDTVAEATLSEEPGATYSLPVDPVLYPALASVMTGILVCRCVDADAPVSFSFGQGWVVDHGSLFAELTSKISKKCSDVDRRPAVSCRILVLHDIPVAAKRESRMVDWESLCTAATAKSDALASFHEVWLIAWDDGRRHKDAVPRKCLVVAERPI